MGFTPGGVSPRSSLNKTTPVINNLSMSTGGTEYSQALPSNTKSFLVRIREHAKVEVRYASASTEFMTLEAGSVYTEEFLSGTSNITLYLKSQRDNIVAEIVSWT